MCYNRVKYSTAAGTYCTTNDVKVTFCIPLFPSSKRIFHRFYVDNDESESVIGYGMIIGRDLMVHLGLMADFKYQFLQWDFSMLTMKEPRSLLGNNLTSRKMRWVIIHTEEPASTREDTERW